MALLASAPTFGPWTLDFGLRPRQAGQRCPAAERNDPADQVDCGAGQIGTVKGAKSVLPHRAQSQDQRKTASALEPCAQPEFQSTAFPFNFTGVGWLRGGYWLWLTQFATEYLPSACHHLDRLE